MKIMAPYENGIDYFLKTENSENIFLYAVPFWYDCLSLNNNNIFMRDEYTEYITDIKEITKNNFFLFLNDDGMLEDEILKKYYIDFLGIKYFIAKNELQYRRIVKYKDIIKIFRLENDFVYNTDNIKERYYFLNSFDKEKINKLLNKIKQQDLVNFIIPYSNTTPLIRQCIFQNIEFMIKNSDYKPYFILVCDGTNDEEEVKAITKKYNDYILYLNTNVPAGADGARNLGLKNAYGKRVIFWDADDLIIDKYLADELYLIDDDIEVITLELYFIADSNITNVDNYNCSAPIRICVNKNLIDGYDWKYQKIYKEEDTCFYSLLNISAKNKMVLNQFVGVYNYAIIARTTPNLAENGSQKYGKENAILSLLISKKIIIETAIKLKDEELLKKGTDSMISDYKYWQQNDKLIDLNNVELLFRTAFQKLYELFKIEGFNFNYNNNDKLNELFNLMIDDNIKTQKTINTFKNQYELN